MKKYSFAAKELSKLMLDKRVIVLLDSLATQHWRPLDTLICISLFLSLVSIITDILKPDKRKPSINIES